MNLGISALDLFAASLFLGAAIVCLAVSRLTAARTQLWPFVTAAYLFFFAERALNALEWGQSNARLAFVDAIEDYASVAACLILLYVALQFIGLTRARPGPTH